MISIKEELLFYVPNCFTPDNVNGYNQIFKPIFTSGFDPRDYALYIFNRWGELIYESRNADIGWDGSYGTWKESKQEIANCNDGTYTWQIDFVATDDNSRKTITGHVNLIR